MYAVGITLLAVLLFASLILLVVDYIKVREQRDKYKQDSRYRYAKGVCPECKVPQKDWCASGCSKIDILDYR